MRQIMRGARFMVLALVIVGWLAADSSMILAGGKASARTDTWEFILPIRYVSGETLDFDGGTTVDLSSDLGWGFGFGYNFSESMNLDFEFAWMDTNYQANVVADLPIDDFSATGELDAFSSQVNFTYNIMPKTITPYISAGIGWNWFDTNIPTGSASTGCWWDPWYGYICTTYQDTASGDGFSYGFGAGLRIEPKESFFLRIGINDNWQDFGNYSDTPDFLSYRLDMGWKF